MSQANSYYSPLQSPAFPPSSPMLPYTDPVPDKTPLLKLRRHMQRVFSSSGSYPSPASSPINSPIDPPNYNSPKFESAKIEKILGDEPSRRGDPQFVRRSVSLSAIPNMFQKIGLSRSMSTEGAQVRRNRSLDTLKDKRTTKETEQPKVRKLRREGSILNVTKKIFTKIFKDKPLSRSKSMGERSGVNNNREYENHAGYSAPNTSDLALSERSPRVYSEVDSISSTPKMSKREHVDERLVPEIQREISVSGRKPKRLPSTPEMQVSDKAFTYNGSSVKSTFKPLTIESLEHDIFDSGDGELGNRAFTYNGPTAKSTFKPLTIDSIDLEMFNTSSSQSSSLGTTIDAFNKSMDAPSFISSSTFYEDRYPSSDKVSHNPSDSNDSTISHSNFDDTNIYNSPVFAELLPIINPASLPNTSAPPPSSFHQVPLHTVATGIRRAASNSKQHWNDPAHYLTISNTHGGSNSSSSVRSLSSTSSYDNKYISPNSSPEKPARKNNNNALEQYRMSAAESLYTMERKRNVVPVIPRSPKGRFSTLSQSELSLYSVDRPVSVVTVIEPKESAEDKTEYPNREEYPRPGIHDHEYENFLSMQRRKKKFTNSSKNILENMKTQQQRGYGNVRATQKLEGLLDTIAVFDDYLESEELEE
ncbi:hypothetical protein HK098_004606 [Nowakowskiella sp. JEL0407]|nr:hypothetical protein HK098_004606 [Nowakowskiella sp. JEL0407]